MKTMVYLIHGKALSPKQKINNKQRSAVAVPASLSLGISNVIRLPHLR